MADDRKPRGGKPRRPASGRGGSDRASGQRGQSDARRSQPRGDRQERKDRSGGNDRSPAVRKPITAGGELPKWVREEIQRVTPSDRREATYALLAEAANSFASGRHAAALSRLEEAKQLSPRATAVRELMGLSAYRLGQWKKALQELRTFRRFAGETTHMPIEMDALRALDRGPDVEKTWELFQELGGRREVEDEARVVYASYLIDVGRPLEAWKVIAPGRLVADATESMLRRWYVASRVAVVLGDAEAAGKLKRAVEQADHAFPGLEELSEEIARL